MTNVKWWRSLRSTINRLEYIFRLGCSTLWLDHEALDGRQSTGDFQRIEFNYSSFVYRHSTFLKLA